MHAGPGSRDVRYEPQCVQDFSEKTRIQYLTYLCHISSMPERCIWSSEELRWADLRSQQQGPARGAAAATRPGGGAPTRPGASGRHGAAAKPGAAPEAAWPTDAGPVALAAPAPVAFPVPANASQAAAAAGAGAAILGLELQAGSQVSLHMEAGGGVTLRLAAPVGQPLTVSLATGPAAVPGEPGPSASAAGSG